ncbi:Potassium transporter family protein [Euphorbia peplus]|nr:Potassium transporter family protein [Euphorbia peplus]
MDRDVVEEEIVDMSGEESNVGNEKGVGDGKSLANREVFDLEANRVKSFGRNNVKKDYWSVLKLAFQCIGVVYGDLGTSPLYVLPGIFPNGIQQTEDLMGVLCLIFYSIIIITLVKYVLVVLSANDNGEGGTFALYSLLCRHAKLNVIPNQQAEDAQLSNYKLEIPNSRFKRASALKTRLENSYIMKFALLIMGMLGVSMVLGDGILTPCISVLSAVGGIKEASDQLTDTTIMWISVAILILLFQVQRLGTRRVGYSFAPILTLWFFFIAIIGIFNIFKHEPSVLKAVNPWYGLRYMIKKKKEAWISLGGVILCLTGSEALFADLGHFNVLSIRLSSCSLVIPSVTLAYFGQCSYLYHNQGDSSQSFYKSLPKPMYWPQFIVAVLAAIIGSQSLISASFSIIQQAVALGCFPRVKVVHTSSKHEGQVYVPEINTILMLACVGVTLGFKNTLQIGNAYGIAVAFVFVITSVFLVLIMIMVWKTNILLVILYVLTIGVCELSFLSSTLYKFSDGGYLPLLFAFITVWIMFIWNYGYRKKYTYELENKVSMQQLTDIISNENIHRVKGLGLFYTPLVHGVTPIFTHYVSSISSLHSVVVFVSIKSLPINKVVVEERFLFQRVKQGEMIFRCIVRYGYKDSRKDQEMFETTMAERLKVFIQEENENGNNTESELAIVDKALKDGVVYLMGEGFATASNGSSLVKRLIIDYLYNWISRCVRQLDEVYLVPREHLLKIGMTYEV